MAITLEFPEECILFVHKEAYDYKKFHIFYVIAFYYYKMGNGHKNAIVEAIEACDKAISVHHNKIDINNKKYLTGETLFDPNNPENGPIITNFSSIINSTH